MTPTTLEPFLAAFRGAVIQDGDAEYESARRIWNASIDKRPGLIVRCSGLADVIAAVRFAREHGLLVAIRGGGHNVGGRALCDGGMVIDLSRMKGIHVDPKARRARVQPGVLLGELDRETHVFGLAVPAGVVSKTGVAGLTLGGGVGWLARKYGLTCDNVRVLRTGDRGGGGAARHAPTSTPICSGPSAAAAATSASSPRSNTACIRSRWCWEGWSSIRGIAQRIC